MTSTNKNTNNESSLAVADRIQIIENLFLRSYSNTNTCSIETLIDTIIALYDECYNSSLRREKSLHSFLEYVKPIVNRIRDLRLKKNDFDIIKVIGRGAFGEVAFVKMKNTEQIYAMKILNKWDIIKRADVCLIYQFKSF